MRIHIFLIFLVFGLAQTPAQCGPDQKQNAGQTKAENKMPDEKVKFENLPDDVKLEDEVREITKNEAGQITSDEIITVEQKLRQLGAKYENDVLVDAAGKEIRFYRPPVRGASQGFEEDRQQAIRDARELAELQEKYTVIILYVNPLKAL